MTSTTIADRVVALAPTADVDNRALGELNTLLDRHLNTDSADQLGWFLYQLTNKVGPRTRIPNSCAFEPLWDVDRKTGIKRLRTDKAALLKLWRKTKAHAREAELVLRIKDLNTRLEALAMRTDSDGRIRTSINIVGTETERHASRQTPMETGGNLHTTPSGHKHLFPADPGYEYFSLDLSGADGWTIACECAILGDSTMLDDLRYGLKPAQLVALLYQHGAAANTWTRADLKAKLPGIKDPPWLYLACKRVIWGTCVTGDHEVLTPLGWQRIDTLPGGMPIVTWNKETCGMKWEIPTERHQFHYEGPLYHFQGNAYDLVTTADHRMPVTSNGNRVIKTKTAAQMAESKSGELPMSGQWQGGQRREPLARLIAAIQSDGHYAGGTRLVFTLRKPRKLERLRQLLTGAGIRFRESNYPSRDGLREHRFYCYNAPIVPKKAGAWMLEWDRESLEAFVNEYPKWDGTTTGPCKTTFCKDKEQLMWLGTFQRLTGRGFVYQGEWFNKTGHGCHRLSLNNRAFADRASMRVTSRPTKQPVYCVSVPSGFFLVRHNDCIMITGNCYGMGELKMSEQILEDSFDPDGGASPVYVEPKTCKALQVLVHSRYPGIRRRQDRIRMLLERDGYLEFANGSRRTFFGRKDDNATLREAYGAHPQVVTTWATSRGWHRLWFDPDNRQPGHDPIVQPLLLVHDSLAGQSPIDRRDWTCTKLRQWFNNPIVIAGIEVTIPFTGHFGPTWAHAGGVEGYEPTAAI